MSQRVNTVPRAEGSLRFAGGLLSYALVALLLFLFLLGVKGLGDGFKLLGRGVLDAFFSATEDPLTGLLVGILATTIVQSSSVTTSMIVGLVAAPENPLPLANAVPMVMGANVGTTVTNTIAALGHIARRNEFRRAFAAATCHDFFNYFSVLILLPVELATGFLRRTAALFASGLRGVGGVDYESPIKGALSAAMGPVEALCQLVFSSAQWQAVLLILLSGGLIFVSLFLLVKVMRQAMQNHVERFVTNALGRRPLLAMVVGVVVTVMVQSSSITTSLLVPLTGAGLITLEEAFPVTLGANIGTTLTALLASLAVTGPNAVAGVEIALVHLFFNLTGTLIIYPWRALRSLPLAAARKLAGAAVKSPRIALIYLMALFYALPALLILLGKLIAG